VFDYNTESIVSIVDAYSGLLARGVGMTLVLTLLGFTAGFAIALLLTVTRYMAPRPARILAQAYIDLFRGTPMLVQLLFIFFALPSLGVQLSAFQSAAVALGLNSGAYQAEILRVAIKGLPEEELHVAESLGLTGWQTMRHVVLPQAVRASLPGLTNEAVMLLKDSSLASVIGVMELTRAGEYMVSTSFKALQSLGIVALVYLALSALFYKAFRAVERRTAIPGFQNL